MVTVPACSGTSELLWVAGMIIGDDGWKAVLLLDRNTAAPPDGAPPLSATVMVAFAPLATVLGLIVRELSTTDAWQMLAAMGTFTVLESVVPPAFRARMK